VYSPINCDSEKFGKFYPDFAPESPPTSVESISSRSRTRW
jgi:hypothetical protein